MGLCILKVVLPWIYWNSVWDLKKSFILLEERVRIAKFLALSNYTSTIGGGWANSGFEAAMIVLKYWNNYSAVILKGKLEHIILSGWF